MALIKMLPVRVLQMPSAGLNLFSPLEEGAEAQSPATCPKPVPAAPMTSCLLGLFPGSPG